MDIGNGTVLHGGDMARGSVLTSSNVASVEVRVANVGMSMQKVGVGRFDLAYRVPSLPFPLWGNYTIRVIARNARGDATERDMGVTIR